MPARIGFSGEVFQAQFNADALDGLSNTGRNAIHINHDVQKPVAPAVSGKVRPVLDLARRQGAAVEHAKLVAGKAERSAFALQFTPLERNVVESSWQRGVTPDPILTVDDWANRHRMLSSVASAEPGRWATSRTPYLKAVMEALSATSRVERVVLMKGAQLGGPLALDTLMPTRSGGTTMGEIQVGDEIFDERGQPCRVTGVSPVFVGRDCYELTFSDGTKVVCDADHPWVVWDAPGKRSKLVKTTTAQMLPRFKVGRRIDMPSTLLVHCKPR